MKRRFWAALALVAALGLAGCTQGDECDKCETDDDCNDPFVCRNFTRDDGSVAGRRCASGAGVSQCRVR